MERNTGRVEKARERDRESSRARAREKTFVVQPAVDFTRFKCEYDEDRTRKGHVRNTYQPLATTLLQNKLKTASQPPA